MNKLISTLAISVLPFILISCGSGGSSGGVSGDGTPTLQADWAQATNNTVGLACGGSSHNTMTITNISQNTTATLGTIDVATIMQIDSAGGDIANNATSTSGTCKTGLKLSYGDTCTLTINVTAGCNSGSFDSGTLKIPYTGKDSTTKYVIASDGTAFSNGSWNCHTCMISDARLKKDIHAMSLGLKETLALRPVYFKYNGLGGVTETKAEQLGLIAQEVEKAAPELIKNRNVKLYADDKNETTIKTVNYSALTFMLINSVKELESQNAELKARIDRLEAIISSEKSK